METTERLESEWCGFDGTKNVEPKSFAELPFELKTEAYQALAYLLGDPYLSKDIHRVGSARLSTSDNAFFLNLLLADSIIQVAEFLRTSLRPRYAVKAEFRTAVKGRINFHKTISRSGGLLHKHFCEFPELTLHDELFGLLKIAVPHMVSNLSVKSSPELKLRLLTASVITAEATKTLPSPSNIQAVAFKIISGRIRFRPDMGSIKDALRIIAYYCVGRDIGAVADGKVVPGILLNLNRPFERLLISSLETLDGFKRDREPLNDIYSLDSSGRPTSIDPMRPDCKGMLTVGSSEKYIVLDAKHKIFVDEKGEIENVSRADLYQAISYGLTSKHQAKTQTVGLVGLSKEVQINDLLVSRISDIVVDYGSEKFVVQRYTINFAAALIKIYRALQSTGSPEAIYVEIGLLLKSGILKPERSSEVAG